MLYFVMSKKTFGANGLERFAFVRSINENINLKAVFDDCKAVDIVLYCKTKREAFATADHWNECYKNNGEGGQESK